MLLLPELISLVLVNKFYPMKQINLFGLTIILLFLVGSCREENDAGEIYTLNVLQRSNYDEFAEGEMKMIIIKEIAEDKTQKDLMTRTQILETHFFKIDTLCGDMMYFLESIKKEMFKEVGESLALKSNSNILYFENEKKSCPLSYNLQNVKYTGGTDVLVSEKAEKIKDTLRFFRGEICRMIENSVIVEKNMRKFYFIDPNINDFKDIKEYNQKFEKATLKMNLAQDDAEAIKQIYFQLTKSDQEWDNILTEKDSWIKAFRVLVSLQNDVLNARRNTFALMGSRFCIGEYGFTRIIPIVNGPEAAKPGDKIQLQVFYGAINQDKAPYVEVLNGGKVTNVKNGLAYVEVVVPNEKELTITGRITVKNKSGVPKTENWTKKIYILPKE